VRARKVRMDIVTDEAKSIKLKRNEIKDTPKAFIGATKFFLAYGFAYCVLAGRQRTCDR
jgi:hypothetical protein